jgi:mevalonate kinase
MASRQLTEKQQKFLDALFEGANGDVGQAVKMAGYSGNTTTTEVVRSLKDEILEVTQMYLARNAPKAAQAMVGALNNPTELGIRDKMAASKELLDRIGIVKTDKISVVASGGVILLPPKQVERANVRLKMDDIADE